MMNEYSGISRRKLLRTTAIGVPAAGLLAFGSTLVTATSANALEVDGYWGTETTELLQSVLMQGVLGQSDLLPFGDPSGTISSQPISRAEENPGLASGWQWVSDEQVKGSGTIARLQREKLGFEKGDGIIGPQTISALQTWLGQTADGVLDGPSPTIKALQNYLNSQAIEA
ncbi:peptidoglycan-binding protein [Rothia dentocariosa]|uniref:peptidoglycan-binding protein n=1 Tax=Rothia dentocariosa TaxID=2047 RepID=UPI0028800E56|nr:peptidoglycan-binding protein [Rothia dentocariosa]